MSTTSGARFRLVRLRALRRSLWQLAQRLDPVRFVLRSATPCDRVALVCVYRARNADHVRQLVRRLPPSCLVLLWALDDVPADLATLTLGRGQGSRFELLNRLIAQVPADRCADGLVLADDDVRFVVGGLCDLVDVGERARLDIYQPAHTACSFANWPFVRRRRFTVLRRTEFVEQGPLVVLSARAQRVLLPLPEDMGMGWGIEARWWIAAKRAGLAFGIVDAVAMQHLDEAGTGYDRDAQDRQLADEARAAGLTDIRDLQRVLSRSHLLMSVRSTRNERADVSG